ncbi:MAG: phosphopantetheine-binding protein [Oscillospiraceae bacterium]
MIDITDILYEICEDENVKDPDYDLIDSGLLDSYAMIELFSELEDYGIELYPTQIDRERLRTPRSIQELINETEN